jgi:hypothetical protein
MYATAVSSAVHKAGFDGANGYLLNQFLQDVSKAHTRTCRRIIRILLGVLDVVVRAGPRRL